MVWSSEAKCWANQRIDRHWNILEIHRWDQMPCEDRDINFDFALHISAHRVPSSSTAVITPRVSQHPPYTRSNASVKPRPFTFSNSLNRCGRRVSCQSIEPVTPLLTRSVCWPGGWHRPFSRAWTCLLCLGQTCNPWWEADLSTCRGTLCYANYLLYFFAYQNKSDETKPTVSAGFSHGTSSVSQSIF